MWLELDTAGKVRRVGHIQRDVASLLIEQTVRCYGVKHRADKRAVQALPETLPVLRVIHYIAPFQAHLSLALIHRTQGKPVGRLPKEADVPGRRKGLLHIDIDISDVGERPQFAAADIQKDFKRVVVDKA